MRYILLTLCLFLPLLSFAQEEIEYKEYSYSEFFQMIENEEDSVFRLSNALIINDSETDSLHRYDTNFRPIRTDTIYVEKFIELNNVQFYNNASFNNDDGQNSIYHVRFRKPVLVQNTTSVDFSYCTFDEGLTIDTIMEAVAINRRLEDDYSFIDKNGQDHTIEVSRSVFKKSLELTLFNLERPADIGLAGRVRIGGNKFLSNEYSDQVDIDSKNAFEFYVHGNSFNGISRIGGLENKILTIQENIFEQNLSLRLENGVQGQEVTLLDNTLKKNVLVTTDAFSIESQISWEDFENKVLDERNLERSLMEEILKQGEQSASRFDLGELKQIDSLISQYKLKGIPITEESYLEEKRLLAKFSNLYKSRLDQKSVNSVYREIKDLETLRFKAVYQALPNFENFFAWKINQFLKIFSAYGTQPAKAIVFSVYVICLFAFIYLFFPNYWDSHGKNRIVNRYSFFLKYMKRDAGMQDVYLEEKKSEILAYQDYIELIESSGKNVPKFFQATALPIYKWAISGTKLTASLLSKVDVMKGTWSELPQSKRVWKSVLLISAFLIALAYDIFIKMLNALMLSINTFTTLGFGEIPIKGLPRYLAIIQGFIGWFMLTIFSVSLISQLLN